MLFPFPLKTLTQCLSLDTSTVDELVSFGARVDLALSLDTSHPLGTGDEGTVFTLT